jgi:hypothetical protein
MRMREFAGSLLHPELAVVEEKAKRSRLPPASLKTTR